MHNHFVTVPQAIALIGGGKPLIVSGAENLLSQLPRGNWIGGTSVYFMTGEGGVIDRGHLFVSVLDEVPECRIASLSAAELSGLAAGRFDHGFAYLLLPGFSAAHLSYATDCASYPGLFDQPVTGWVTGVHLDDLGRVTPKVFNGATGEAHDDRAAILYARLDATKDAEIDVVDLFTQGDGPSIVFPATGFTADECLIDGWPGNLVRHMAEQGIGAARPLVADYNGAMVNLAVQEIDPVEARVTFYAPVIAGQFYYFAAPIADYPETYLLQTHGDDDAASQLSCNSILNFVHAKLDGKKSGSYVGPVSSGEIAYILLNQTLVHLQIE